MPLVLPVTLALVAIVVAIHHEVLRFASRRFRREVRRPRMAVIGGLAFALAAHVLEVWVFALGYFALSEVSGVGALRGDFSGGLLDCSYYSFAVYTSVGFGDITPEGPLRLLTGMEALTGLVLIAWTASFMFLQIQAQWGEDRR